MAHGDPALEEALRLPVTHHFLRQGFRVKWEVKLTNRYADVVAAKPGDIVGVELKLTDWRTASRQALAYQLGCHRTYVALPEARAHKVAEKRRGLFDDVGCGLLAVDHETGRVDVVREAAPSRRLLPFLADRLEADVLVDSPPWVRAGVEGGWHIPPPEGWDASAAPPQEGGG